MIKRGILFFCALILILSFVSAQNLEQTQKEIEDSANELQEGIDKLRNITDPQQVDIRWQKWKEFILRNKAVSGINEFFIKINVVFVILFGMDWSFSIAMAVAFLFWVFTFISIFVYMKNFQGGALGLLYSLIFIVLLAQINLFEYIGKWADKLIFYKASLLWRTLFLLFIIGVCIGWFSVNRLIAKEIEKKKKKQIEEMDKHSKEVFNKMVNAAIDGASERPLGGNHYG